MSEFANHADLHAWHSPPTSIQPPGLGPARLAEILSGRLGPAATFATTEHFNLQTARSITVAESNGRATAYLAALSSNLIALGFIGETSRLGAAFHAFALILLPVLSFIGVTTFERLVQSSIEDIAYARRIGLLRGFYLELAPELKPYLAVVVPSSECPRRAPTSPGRWQLTLTTAGMVAVVNSAVIGSFAGLLLQTLGVGSLAITLTTGATVGAAALLAQRRRHRLALDAFSPDAVDRAAIFVPESQRAESA
ncbi:MAG TPA: hypothetical protein VFI54_04860 [Solirubrobacteraceae bacterium]|nr:hypothetical protein [Solirubrobacteraceae bacterium]